MENHTNATARMSDGSGLKAGRYYSAATVAGGLVFGSGWTPRDEAKQIVGDTIAEQTPAALDNVAKVTAAGGASLTDIVKAFTRAGMGSCQGKQCNYAIASVLASAEGSAVPDVDLYSVRPPLEPLILADRAGFDNVDTTE